MPRIIFTCRYMSGVKQQLHNLVGYIARREGVEKITNSSRNLPASQKQQELIAQVLADFPDASGMFEHEDYTANPTQGNASEFITAALERNADLIADRANLVDYMANRPRVERSGEHGLFSDKDTPVVLSQVQTEVANHTGNVWTNVVSLHREDAARLGYDNAAAWQALMRGQRNTIAEQMKIKPENLRWFAAFHNESHHPHVHFIAFSKNPKEGFLTEPGIEKIRSSLAREIFEQDLQQIYIQQTARRNDLQEKAQDTMQQYIAEMGSGVCVSSVISEQITLLSQRLQNISGKKQYGYLKADVKAIIDSIVDELAKDARAAGCYRAWQDLRASVLQTYSDKPPDPLPLSQQKEFKRVKNIVIQEALKLGTHVSILKSDDDMFSDAAMDDLSQSQLLFPVEPSELELFESPSYEDMPDRADYVDYTVDWSDEYKQARAFLFGANDAEPDFVQAHALFLTEAQEGNALAMHDLGRMYSDGLGREIDTTAAHDWYAKAMAAFLSVESEQPKPYTQYRIGKMYAAGLGTEQDYTKAVDWFTQAAEKNHKYAQYSLGGLYYSGNSVAQDHMQAFDLYKKSSLQKNAYASYELAKMLRDGIGTEQNATEANIHFKTAFDGFVDMEQNSKDDKLQYRIGQMLRDGVGTDADVTQATAYFERSAKLGNVHAQYALAKIYLADGSNAEKIAQAVAWLQKSSDGGNHVAQYALGKLYRDGDHVERDIAKAVKLFTQSAEQENEYAQYTLGKLYLVGEDVPKNVDEAVRWLSASAELGNQYAQYTLGKLYLAGEDVPKNVDEAVRLLMASAEQNNQFAQYQLGKLFLLGKDVLQNREVAVQWFTLAAAQGNEYAQYFLDHMNDYIYSTLISSTTQLLRSLGKIFEEQQQKQTAQMGQLDRKRQQQLREKKQAQGHARDEHIQTY